MIKFIRIGHCVYLTGKLDFDLKKQSNRLKIISFVVINFLIVGQLIKTSGITIRGR
jgi:hypothetical protein